MRRRLGPGDVVINGYYELAEALLESGADPNVPDPRGSALHAVASCEVPGSVLVAVVRPADGFHR